MSIDYNEAVNLLASLKSLAPPFAWKSVPNDKISNPQRQLECPVEASIDSRYTLNFRAVIKARYPEQMSLQMEIKQATSAVRLILYRLDLCPMGQHFNEKCDDPDLSGVIFKMGETHEHIITDNFTSGFERLRVNCDMFARKIEEPPTNFSESVNYICARLNITNGGDLPPPEYQGLML